MNRLLALILLCCLTALPANASAGEAMPEGFIYLKDVLPQVHQDMRYYGHHNFLGRPVDGYQAAECVLTTQAADALKKVSHELAASGLGILVFDCYRPQRAVNDFIAWAATDDDRMHDENYPRVNKKDFFKLGYVAKKSSHSRGSTVDLTIVAEPAPRPADYHQGQALTDCTAPYTERYFDGGLDMGTGFDCMDPLSAPLNTNVGATAYHNRMILRDLMVKNGFEPYEEEWWHFTLKNEPFPDTFFDFPIVPDEQ